MHFVPCFLAEECHEWSRVQDEGEHVGGATGALEQSRPGYFGKRGEDPQRERPVPRSCGRKWSECVWFSPDSMTPPRDLQGNRER